MVMGRLFERQLAKARRGNGEVDLDILARLVTAAYDDAECDRARTDRSVKLMAEELERAHAHLFDAFAAVPEGIAIFDAEDRYVLWNNKYAEMYAASAYALKIGARFEEVLHAGIAAGQHPDANGREEEWLATRLARHRNEASSHEQRLPNGRWIRVEERRTSDGGSIGVLTDITDLKQREESFRLLFDNNPVPMWVCDRDGLRVVAINDAAVTHYGYSRERFLSMTVLDLHPDEDRAAFLEFIRSGQPGTGDVHWRHLRADASVIQVVAYSRNLQYQGNAASLVAVIDVTDRKIAEDKLRSTREFLNTIVENVPSTIVVKDVRDFRYLLINRAGEEYYGIPRSQMIGKTAHDVLPRASAEIVTALDRQLLQNREKVDNEHALDTPGHGTRIASSTRMPILNSKGEPQYLLAVIDDITEKKEAQARIAYLAHHDPLTDLPNRTAFNERLAQVFENANRQRSMFAVMCMDLDRFKEVNDIFGHGSGDELLREVANRLKSASGDTFLARLGGDEFTMILEEPCEPDEIAALTERMRASIEGDINVNGTPVRIGLSGGVAIYPVDALDSTTLVANADAALYRAKADGRGSIRFFAADIDKQLRERRALQRDLRAAIVRREFTLAYQPQARVDGRITGFEALLRWHHPVRGNVPPAEFIPVAEDSGLIITIGEWVLREACREAASWPRPLHIAVNLSPAQFKHGDLPKLVHEILLDTGLPPHRLELEITESVLIGDFSRALLILRQLKAMGLRIAMDDFGTGYSSLSYLQAFPFDKIKIDRSFVANLDDNAQSAPIVRAVIGLGRGLSVPVAAEGVETTDQLSFLSREACDEIQGYLIGRPRPIADYAELVGRAPIVQASQLICAQ